MAANPTRPSAPPAEVARYRANLQQEVDGAALYRLLAAQARGLAEGLVGEGRAALDTLAREERGIDPAGLGGSAWAAAATSFLLFALGALLPVLPYMVAAGPRSLAASVALSGLGLFAVGAGITLFTGRRPLSSGLRQVAFGLAAAAVTYGLGRLVGGGLGL